MLIPLRRLAAEMGVQPRTLRRWLAKAGVPIVRPSRRVLYVRAADWASWVSAHTEYPRAAAVLAPAVKPTAINVLNVPPQLRAFARALKREGCREAGSKPA